MTDITANVVVSMPSQLFTMARSFKAVANGKIYIGKIDTDPVNPENQIQVYVENEDGSHVPVLQPIIINAAGYPVYNGQIAKFVTVQGHSMAVYDAYGAQQFYFPNVLKYDPDQLRHELSGYDGAKAIGECPDIAMLRTIEPKADKQRILVREHTLNTGYGGGQFRARLDGSAYADNNGTIIKTAGGAVWLRINADTINPLMFGAIPDGVTDCSLAFVNALNAGSIYVPEGDYVVSEVQIPNKTSIRGAGYKSKIIIEPGHTGFTAGNESAFNSGSTIDFYDGCNISDIHLSSSSSTVYGTVGIRTIGLSSSKLENIRYTKLNMVIRQDHADGCVFSNISNSDLENQDTDCAFVIYSDVTKRSNDNIYKEFIARATDTCIRLGVASGSPSSAQHDGITIKDCILFPTQTGDSIYVAHTVHSAISGNKLFVPARNGIRSEFAMINTNIQNNEITWPGRFTAGGAPAVFIQTASSSSVTAYGQCDISGNVISMPSGSGFLINGLGQFNLHDNTIVSPNNIKSTATGPFTAKSWDAIRIGAGSNRFSVANNLVVTGRHGQGGDDFSTNWRWDVYVEQDAALGRIKHDGVNVRNLSLSTSWDKVGIKLLTKQDSSLKEIRSPYSNVGWSSPVGGVTITAVSEINPYDSEKTNTVLEFAFPGVANASAQCGQVPTTEGGSLGAIMMIRAVGSPSAMVTMSIKESGSSLGATRSIMVSDGWEEVEFRKVGTIAAGFSMFTISCSDKVRIQIAELRVTPTKLSTPPSGNHYYGVTAPTTGFWKVGDFINDSSGGSNGWRCTAGGTPGSWSAV
ncbi:hypothetical protein AAS08_001493 [Escherichia coli]|nr:hypothetical protein [Escherichia coli]